MKSNDNKITPTKEKENTPIKSTSPPQQENSKKKHHHQHHPHQSPESNSKPAEKISSSVIVTSPTNGKNPPAKLVRPSSQWRKGEPLSLKDLLHCFSFFFLHFLFKKYEFSQCFDLFFDFFHGPCLFFCKFLPQLHVFFFAIFDEFLLVFWKHSAETAPSPSDNSNTNEKIQQKPVPIEVINHKMQQQKPKTKNPEKDNSQQTKTHHYPPPSNRYTRKSQFESNNSKNFNYNKNKSYFYDDYDNNTNNVNSNDNKKQINPNNLNANDKKQSYQNKERESLEGSQKGIAWSIGLNRNFVEKQKQLKQQQMQKERRPFSAPKMRSSVCHDSNSNSHSNSKQSNNVVYSSYQKPEFG